MTIAHLGMQPSPVHPQRIHLSNGQKSCTQAAITASESLGLTHLPPTHNTRMLWMACRPWARALQLASTAIKGNLDSPRKYQMQVIALKDSNEIEESLRAGNS